LWRHETMTATMRFLEALIVQNQEQDQERNRVRAG
jgi:hypothetical protein